MTMLCTLQRAHRVRNGLAGGYVAVLLSVLGLLDPLLALDVHAGLGERIDGCRRPALDTHTAACEREIESTAPITAAISVPR